MQQHSVWCEASDCFGITLATYKAAGSNTCPCADLAWSVVGVSGHSIFPRSKKHIEIYTWFAEKTVILDTSYE